MSWFQAVGWRQTTRQYNVLDLFGGEAVSMFGIGFIPLIGVQPSDTNGLLACHLQRRFNWDFVIDTMSSEDIHLFFSCG